MNDHVMDSTDFIMLEEFLNQACFDLDIFILTCPDPEKVRRADYLRSSLSKSITMCAPLAWSCKKGK